MCRNPGVLTYDWTKNGGQVRPPNPHILAPQSSQDLPPFPEDVCRYLMPLLMDQGLLAGARGTIGISMVNDGNPFQIIRLGFPGVASMAIGIPSVFQISPVFTVP
jgi:hypothetical protein